MDEPNDRGYYFRAVARPSAGRLIQGSEGGPAPEAQKGGAQKGGASSKGRDGHGRGPLFILMFMLLETSRISLVAVGARTTVCGAGARPPVGGGGLLLSALGASGLALAVGSVGVGARRRRRARGGGACATPTVGSAPAGKTCHRDW